MAHDFKIPQLKKPTTAQTYGAVGHDIFAGQLKTDFIRELSGARKIKTYTEMRDNSAPIGAIMFAIKNLIRQVDWAFKCVDVDAVPEDEAAEEFLEAALASIDFKTYVEQALSMIVFGWATHEIIYARAADKIVWDKFSPRPQKTLYKWLLPDEDQDLVLGFEQLTVHGGSYVVPMDKCIHLIVKEDDGSPEGMSLLRNAYRSYYLLRNIENNEAIRIERDATGVPLIRLPSDCLAPDAPPEKQAIATDCRNIVANLRNDEQAGVLLPSDRDDKGNLYFDLEIIGGDSGSSRVDTNEPIKRYNTQILMVFLADFLMLGHDKVGSFALSSDKTNMFSTAIGGILDIIKTGVNRAAQQLLELNGMAGKVELRHSDLEKLDFAVVADVIQKLTQAGMVFSDHGTEEFIRNMLKLPEREEDDMADFVAPQADGAQQSAAQGE